MVRELNSRKCDPVSIPNIEYKSVLNIGSYNITLMVTDKRALIHTGKKSRVYEGKHAYNCFLLKITCTKKSRVEMFSISRSISNVIIY